MKTALKILMLQAVATAVLIIAMEQESRQNEKLVPHYRQYMESSLKVIENNGLLDKDCSDEMDEAMRQKDIIDSLSYDCP